MQLALKITPQRNTQYAHLAQALALPELMASPLAPAVQDIAPRAFASQPYLLVSFDERHLDSWRETLLPVLSRLSAISEMYEYFESIGGVAGPFLRPIDTYFSPFVPPEMAQIRRYKGKTNEIFTRVLLNVAIFAGAYSDQFSGRLRILDPLAGGGTTLFLALAAGYDALGIEENRQDIETMAAFVREFLQGEHISYKELDERRKQVGRRYQFVIRRRAQAAGESGSREPSTSSSQDETRLLVLAQGDTAQADLHLRDVPGGPRVHAIVGDLPYGFQHFGEIATLLRTALPAWERLLLPGGTLALAWNATRIKREDMVALIGEHTQLVVRHDPPYTQFAHPVDRVIKQRDILVAVR